MRSTWNWSQVGNFGAPKLLRLPLGTLLSSMSFENGVLEGSRLDFGGPRLDFGDPEARFWRVLERFFRDFPSLLAGNMQELLSNFKLKLRGSSWELQLPVPFHLTPTSNFNHEFPKGRWAAVSPPGGLQLE